jgi:hypothetical protein
LTNAEKRASRDIEDLEVAMDKMAKMAGMAMMGRMAIMVAAAHAESTASVGLVDTVDLEAIRVNLEHHGLPMSAKKLPSPLSLHSQRPSMPAVAALYHSSKLQMAES